MLDLFDQSALWDTEPEAPVLPSRENFSTPENHRMRKRAVMLPPTLVVILF